MEEEKKNLKEKLRKYNISPNKLMGQSFLLNREIADLMIETAKVKKDDLILEIGPGLGFLTKKLVKKAGQVIGVEKDETLSKVLNKEFKNFSSFSLISKDILDVNLSEITEGREYKVVSNLPFQITSPFLSKLIKEKKKPQAVSLLVQKELGERITALPSESQRGYLSVLIQSFFEVERIREVLKRNFYPQPKVKGILIKLTPRVKEAGEKKEKNEKFFKFVQAGFSLRRKKLVNSLDNKLGEDKSKIKKAVREVAGSEDKRAQELTIGEWEELFRELIS